MAEDFEDLDDDEALRRLQEVCDESPTRGLAAIDALVEKVPQAAKLPRVRWAQALAHRTLGIAHLGDGRIGFPNADEYRGRFTDEQAEHIEQALCLVGEILAENPDYLDTAFPGGDGWETVDVWATFLEVCRPGRVQEVLGFTKLGYWGMSRHGMTGHVKGAIDPNLFFWKFSRVRFTPKGVARSAYFYDVGVSGDGRRYLAFFPVTESLDQLQAGGTLGDLGVQDPIAVLEDGACLGPATAEDLKAQLSGSRTRDDPRHGTAPRQSGWFRRLFGG